MLTQMKSWGNSKAIRIPKEMLTEAGFHEQDDLDVEVKGQQIIISKAHQKISLEQRIEKYGPIRKISDCFRDIDPQGREVWTNE